MAGAQLCVDAGSSRGASGGQENSPKRPAGSSGQKNIVGDHGKENPVKKKKKLDIQLIRGTEAGLGRLRKRVPACQRT